MEGDFVEGPEAEQTGCGVRVTAQFHCSRAFPQGRGAAGNNVLHRENALSKLRLHFGAPIAQLDRAADYGSAGYRFNSYWVHHSIHPLFAMVFKVSARSVSEWENLFRCHFAAIFETPAVVLTLSGSRRWARRLQCGSDASTQIEDLLGGNDGPARLRRVGRSTMSEDEGFQSVMAIFHGQQTAW